MVSLIPGPVGLTYDMRSDYWSSRVVIGFQLWVPVSRGSVFRTGISVLQSMHDRGNLAAAHYGLFHSP